jgi:hypothetical protein
MAQPSPIYVSPSTTFVQVNPLQSPYSEVLLNAVAYPGQVVTVLDTTSSFGVLTTPIVVSTLANSFQDGSISTIINQPQGFLTAQSLATNKWAFLNSFPFRNQYVSAGVLNLTTSTLFTALASTVQEYVSSLTVESLTVTGNFLQTEGITLNTNLSSLGTVEFLSSLSVWDDVYLSSALSTLGPVQLFSSLTVLKNFFTKSSITTVSSFFISGSLLSMGSLSTPSLILQDGIVGTSMEVQNSTPITNIAPFSTNGSVQILGTLSSLSSLITGGLFQTNLLLGRSNAIFQSSGSLFQSASISSFTSTTKDISTLGSMGVGNQLFVGYDVTTKDSIRAHGDGYIRDTVTIASTLVTSSLVTNTLETFGDYANNSTIAQISSILVRNGLGAGFMSTAAAFLRNVETYSDFAIRGDLTQAGDLDVQDYISTVGSVRINQTASLLGSISTKDMTVQTLLNVGESVNVNVSTITNLGALYPLNNTSVNRSLYGLGDLTCGGVFTISSITLPSSLLGNNFTTGDVFVGTSGIAMDSLLSKVVTSSVTVGYIPNSQYVFDLSGSLFLSSVQLSSPLVSTQILNPMLSFYSQIQVGGGMGVNVEPQRSTFVCQPVAYFLSSPVFVFSTLSTSMVNIAGLVEGSFQGDGSLLSNLRYPANVSCFELSVTSTINVNFDGFLNGSSIQADQLTLTSFTNKPALTANSSIQVGSLHIWGDANAIEYNLGQNVLQTSSAIDLLVINDVKFYGLVGGQRVAINEDLQGTNFTAALGIYSTLGVESIDTNILLPVDTFRGRKVTVSTAFGYNGEPLELIPFNGFGATYVSTGRISTLTAPFFLGENDIYDSRFNTVQPFQSTLQFNSTLFVHRETQSVGINTQPNFSLDAQSVEATTTFPGLTSFTNQVQLISNQSTSVYYAFIQSNISTSNIQFSLNGAQYSNNTIETVTGLGLFEMGSYFSAGIRDIASSKLIQYFLGQVTSGVTQTGSILYFDTNFGIPQLSPATFTGAQTPMFMTAMATDGQNFLATGIAPPGFTPFGKLFVATAAAGFKVIPPGTTPPPPNEFTFVSAVSFELFLPISGRSNGGYDIVYTQPLSGGPCFIVVGAGSNPSGPGYTSAYRVLIFDGGTGNGQCQVLQTNVDELRAIITYKTDVITRVGDSIERGQTVLVATGQMYNAMTVEQGRIVTSIDNGLTWTVFENLFTTTGLCLATDGFRVVVGGEDSNGNTLYSADARFAVDASYQFSICQGTLFTQRTNAVIYTGTKWVASGNSGTLESQDGITWSNVGNLTTEVQSVGFSSNALESIRVTSSNAIPLYFQNSPNLQVEQLISVPTIAYYPSTLILNNGCILQNDRVIAPGYITSLNPSIVGSEPSTFYTNQAFVSSFVCTNQMTVGWYNLSIQSV